MNKLYFKGKLIRIVQEEGDTFISVLDLSKALNMSNDRISRLNLPADTTKIIPIETAGGLQPVRMVNLEGAASLIYRSRKPEAQSLKRWFVENVMRVAA